jgi:predicted HNH restriction endonuclease
LPSTWLDDIVKAIEIRGGVASLSEIYEELKLIRPNLARTRPEEGYWQATVRRTIESHSSDSQNFEGSRARNDIFYSVEGIGRGIWGLREETRYTPNAFDLEHPEPTTRTRVETYRVLRDTALARRLKELHQDSCQICGVQLQLSDRTYSEAHHIKPLGKPHNGPDVAENILVLCPNDHALLDYGAMKIDLTQLQQNPTHQVAPQYVSYHNTVIANGVFSSQADTRNPPTPIADSNPPTSTPPALGFFGPRHPH